MSWRSQVDYSVLHLFGSFGGETHYGSLMHLTCHNQIYFLIPLETSSLYLTTEFCSLCLSVFGSHQWYLELTPGSVLRNYLGSVRDDRDWAQVRCVQGEHPASCTISPAHSFMLNPPRKPWACSSVGEKNVLKDRFSLWTLFQCPYG